MKKIYESGLNGWNECAERVHVYAFESDEEYFEFDNMNYQERCEYFNVSDDAGSGAWPGATYYEYDFEHSSHHVIMFEHLVLNV